MAIQRCPECGQRLKTNYCDICMRKVPFAGKRAKAVLDPWEYSSAHREEKGHQCVSFGDETPKKTLPKPVITKPKTSNKTAVSVIAVVMGILSLIPALFGIFESVFEDSFEAVPVSEYNMDSYVVEYERSIETTELYGDGEIFVTADSSGLYYGEYSIAMTIENYSDRPIDVSSFDTSVNAYMIPCGFSVGVDAGDTVQAFLILDAMELERAGITEIACVEFSLSIMDWNDWSNVITTDRLRLETPIAWNYNQPVEDSGFELYNDGSVTMRLRSAEMSAPGDFILEAYLENLSGSTAYVYTAKVLVNGEETEGGLWQNLCPGTRAISSCSLWCPENLAVEDIAEIQEITLELYVDYSSEDGMVLETYSESITFDPNAC